jgi:probable rRNA maturation factor
LPFELFISARAGRSFAAYLRAMIPKARVAMRSSLVHLSISLIDAREMGALHKRFMGISGATDVLTFELENGGCEGEIVICVPVARRQARRHGVAVRDELLLYAIHGMLHLSGWDDRTPAGFKAMHWKEDEILRRIGVGQVFAREEASNIRAVRSLGATGSLLPVSRLSRRKTRADKPPVAHKRHATRKAWASHLEPPGKRRGTL